MREMGLTGIPWPEQYGGSGSDYVTYAIVLEELSRKCASTAGMLAAHIGYCAFPLYQFGNEVQKKSWLKTAAEGTVLGTGAIAQCSGWDATTDEGIGITATATADGRQYILDGTIDYVNQAGEADIYVVFARGQPMKRKKGYSAFLIEKGTLGLTFGPKMQKLGLRSMTTAAIRMDNCRIPSANLIGRDGQGLEIAMDTLSIGCMGSAALAVGLAQGALEAAIAYAKVRKQFGKPIGQQQAISFKLADMSTRIEAARLLTYQAAWRMDHSLPYLKEAAMAQMFALRAVEFVTLEAVQVLGGYGYMREYEVERYMRDARCLQANEGTLEMRASMISSLLPEDKFC
jgi:alkylation response protein AidB-like acyl-CoA dehydrogenase